jgi:CRISPR-associated protein Csd2
MDSINKKIDFAVIFTVVNANPNGDPLNGNRPRTNVEGYGEVSDVCVKRKIRNRLIDLGENIFVQSNDRAVDTYKSLRERADNSGLKGIKDEGEYTDIACSTWYDVRAFGQLFAFTGKNKEKGVSIGIRGPVSVHPAFSLSPVSISSTQITKSVNSETPKDGNVKSSDTMGMKYRVDAGTYVFYGSINPQLAKKTGFSEKDAQTFKDALCTLFQNDSSSARPEGSMDVKKIYWWVHDNSNGQYSSAKVHGSLKINPKKDVADPKFFEDYDLRIETLEGLAPEIIEPF